MKESITYDIRSMKMAAAEAEILLRQIRQELRVAEQEMDAAGIHETGRELENVCRGYDSLINDLRAIANLYGSAEAAAAEAAAF